MQTYKIPLLALLVWLSTTGLWAQGITNVKYVQQGNEVLITYDLQAQGQFDVSVHYSTDGGKTFQGPVRYISGDIQSIPSGVNKKINWKAGNELGGISSKTFQLKIIAEREKKLTFIVYGGYKLYVNTKDNAESDTWEQAIQTCQNLTAYGYNDWYLPSKEELKALYQNKESIGGFRLSYYWSSMENFTSNAWIQVFSNGDQYFVSKTSTGRVRCVRRE